ncbi:hypothetical protein [Bradyrhizobium sp.]|uniref:hypothetical protein n=1 Tax=Bradyrhizobium sp. TaxID=376 RepID=UPI003C206EF2
MEIADFRDCAGFRRPECRSIDALRRPAAEKRQGTKSREVEHRRGRGRYEEVLDLGNPEAWRLQIPTQLKRFGTIDAKEGI